MLLKEKIKSSERLKKLSLWMLSPHNEARPRWWIKTFINPMKHIKKKGAKIRATTRLDLFPYNVFSLGSQSVIEDFVVINNGVGDVCIGNNTIIGIGCIIIGPVEIGNNVMLAQHIVVSGLNHGYEDIHTPPSAQPLERKKITINDNTWIGANAVLTAGITIGKHSVIGAGSVVTRNVPNYSVVVGNPARVIKQYNSLTNIWEKI